MYKRTKIKIGEGYKIEKETRSKLEADAIKILQKHQVSFEYEPKDKKLKYTRPESLHTYLPDILIGKTILETKGRFTIQDRQKMILLKEQFPEFNFVMVFQKDQPIRKGSKTLYSEWCKKNKINWILFKDLENYIKQLKNIVSINSKNHDI